MSVSPARLPVQAATQEDMHAHHTAEIKQKRQIIKQKLNEVSKIEAQITKKSKKISQLYNSMFQTDPAPNDTRIAQSLNQENFTLALTNFDKMAALLDKKIELLKIHDSDLKAYIEFLQLMDLK